MSKAQQCHYLAHELAEWMAVNDFPKLFDALADEWPCLARMDDIGGAVYHYDGGDDPDDIRHRVAQRLERLCFRT